MKKLIVYGGAFNPPTPAHISAIKALSGMDGQLVLLPSGADFVRKWKPGQSVLPDLARIELLEKAAKEAGAEDYVVDCLALTENLCTYDALGRLKEKYDADEAWFVIGEDKLEELPRWAHAQELVKDTQFILLNYEKSGAEEMAIEGLDSRVKVNYVKIPTGTEEIHASLIRAAMQNHEISVLETEAGRYMSAHPECVRLAACAPMVCLGKPEKNADAIIECMKNTDADVLVFPELSIAGYTAQDFFLMAPFLTACESAALRVAAETKITGQLVFIGCPVRVNGGLYDCALALKDGEVIAIIPKSHPANFGENYEARWFMPAERAGCDSAVFGGKEIPFGADILIRSAKGGAVIGVEIGSDADYPMPPSLRHAMAGANVIVSPAASSAQVAKTEYRRDNLRMLSAKGVCAYVYAASGAGESTSDLAFAGEKMIIFNGKIVAEHTQSVAGVDAEAICADVDISMLEADRLRMDAFTGMLGYRTAAYSQPTFRFPPAVSAQPFLPGDDPEDRKKRCLEILDIQARGLCQRIRSIGVKKLIIGISGGLDSTLALIVAHNAVKALGMPEDSIIAVTMPGFATSGRTLKNATDLCLQFGTDFRRVDITASCMQHGEDIGHDMLKHDITYENIQARERTQILMDIANMENGIVVGTGDLSELALGWCTYNGDHMSHYCVNGGVPKTLVQFIVRVYAMHSAAPDTRDTLISILDTEITPELVPGGASTEERIGQYALHDFFLFYYMRYGFDRTKLRILAAQAFGAARIAEIDKTLNTFFGRFFVSQFKRNCLPDGPKVGSVAASPRGDLRLPADCGRNYFT